MNRAVGTHGIGQDLGEEDVLQPRVLRVLKEQAFHVMCSVSIGIQDQLGSTSSHFHIFQQEQGFIGDL